MSTKPQIRARVQKALAALTDDELAQKSRAICAHLIKHPAWKTARRVGLFSALPREVDLSVLWAAREQRRLLFPRVSGERLEFCEMDSPDALVAGSFGIMEPPAAARSTGAAQLDLLLVPGLAFGLDASRIGRGGGFYDRALAAPELRARKMAVCFAVQLFDKLPTEPHDQPMDAIVTEHGPA